MDETHGDPPVDPALEEEFQLWREALVAQGHALPDGRAAGGGSLPAPRPAKGPSLPVASQAEELPANGRENHRRPRLAAVFAGVLLALAAVAGYGEFNGRPTVVRRVVAPSQRVVSPPFAEPTPARVVPPDDAARQGSEQADNITHAGEVLALSGDPAGALRLYRQSLSMRRGIAARYPVDAAIQRALAEGWVKVADLWAAGGDATRALGAYQAAEIAWENCARALPGDRDMQRSRSMTALNVGNLLLARGDPAGAARAFQRAVSIQETLRRQEPDQAAWQEDLALAWLRLADARDQGGDDEAAWQACQRALTINETLAARDPANPTWQSDLATVHSKAGDLLLARNEVDPALREYVAAASLGEKMVADATPERRRLAAEAQDRIGQALELKKQPAAALPVYQQALSTIRSLLAASPGDPSLEVLRAVVSFHLGRATADCQPVDLRAARAALREARDQLATLRSADGAYPSKEQAEMSDDVERLLAGLDK